MSRAKIGHEFCPLPRRWHAGWANHQSMHARGLRDALFELADGAPIPVHGTDWLESLCKQMQVHGRERPNVRKTLKAFEADGLIAWDGAGRVLTCFLPDADLQRSVVDSSSTGSPPVTDLSAIGRGSNIPLESTPRNDSTHVRQTDRRDRREETDENAGAGAREDLVGFKFVASLLGRDTFSIPPLGAHVRGYTWIGGRPEAEREAVKLAVDADPWCQANRHLVDAKHLEARWHRYLGGAPKPVASRSAIPAKEQLAEARENTRNAAKAVQALENAPWFDKQTKDGREHPAWRGALDKANQRYRDAMAAEQALRVQLREAS